MPVRAEPPVELCGGRGQQLPIATTFASDSATNLHSDNGIHSLRRGIWDRIRCADVLTGTAIGGGARTDRGGVIEYSHDRRRSKWLSSIQPERLISPSFSGRSRRGPAICRWRRTASRRWRPDRRYGTPARLFTVWFAPQVNMTGVFTGTLAILLGLGFWLGLLAMVIGTVLGGLVVGLPVHLGPAHRHRPGADRARWPSVRAWCCPRPCSGCPRSRWDALVGLFGGAGAGPAARHPVLGGGADRAGRAGRGRVRRLRTHPPVAGGADGGAVRHLRGVRGQARRGPSMW